MRGANGARLRAARFAPAGGARGSVVLSGGRTEPIEKYLEVIEELCARGFAVLAHDWRGQGLSHRALLDRLRGHATGTDELVHDLFALVDRHQARLPRPWIALGHSMGGCLTLLALASGLVERFSAAALVAPMLRVRTAPVPHALAVLLARAACLAGRADRYVLGRRTSPLDEPFEGNPLTHDRARWDRHQAQLAACPDLALGGPTWGWLDTALRATALLARPERLRRVTIPVLVCAAGEDRVVDSAAARAAARQLPDGRFVLVRGARHEILMETDERRAVFWRAFDEVAAEVAPP
ncbi:MAG TPA: alpha/beta hydrolase [Kofleriaceae bacterium]|nr:alpha/beta hydrolase [Kofleriaceae bacterium]